MKAFLKVLWKGFLKAYNSKEADVLMYTILIFDFVWFGFIVHVFRH